MTENKHVTPEKTAEASRVPDAWRPFDHLRKQVNQLFDDFSPSDWHLPFGLHTAAPAKQWWDIMSPEKGLSPVDITEDDTGYKFSVELPGLEEKDVQVHVSNGYLVLSGEKKAEKEEKDKDRYLSERCYGRFQRSFAVPENVDVGKIDAAMKNGVLSIVLPKTGESKKEQVEIAVRNGD